MVVSSLLLNDVAHAPKVSFILNLITNKENAEFEGGDLPSLKYH